MDPVTQGCWRSLPGRPFSGGPESALGLAGVWVHLLLGFNCPLGMCNLGFCPLLDRATGLCFNRG